MPLLWCSISGHGFGHAAQVAPVLNALAALVPDLHVVLRTTVPESFFRARLTVPWEHRPAEQDIGCIQDGPLKIDVPATWAALRRFHDTWNRRLDEETRLLRNFAPDLLLSDISYFALSAGHEAGIRCLALASLAWDEIMQVYVQPGHPDQTALLDRMRACYGLAEFLIRLAPALPLRSFRTIVDVGPIVEPLRSDAARLRRAVGAKDGERLVLVGFGGIALTDLPYERIDRLEGYRFLVDGKLPHPFARIHSVEDTGMRFMEVLASTDIIMTKPGYSTIVEAVDKRKSVVYVRRYNFGDEPSVVDYLHRHGRGIELSMADFVAGRWEPSLTALVSQPPFPAAPPPPGTAQAAAQIAAALAGPRR